MPNIEGLERILAEHPFFRGLDERYGELVAGCAANVVIEAGGYVFREGDPADRFFLVRHGAVAVEVHVPGRDSIVVETIREGGLLGWTWLVPPYRALFDARSLELTRLMSLDATCLRGKMEEDHDLGYELHKRFAPVVAERLDATRLQLIDMYGDDAR